MRLLERYALATGLKIGKQHLIERFFPLPFTRYMTLHASSGMAGKNYPFYGTVVELIKPYLSAAGIEIVQMGTKDDPAIPGCHHIMGKDNIHQASYLIRNALLHLGNDSIWGHRAGHLGVPLVQPWGPTDPANHSSLEHDPAKTAFIVSHRWGKHPTFLAQENPPSIALVCPFAIARAVLDLLKITHTLIQSTVHVGQSFNAPLLEWIPNLPVAPNFNPDAALVVRYDLCVNEAALVQTLQTGRKVNILTKTPLNPQILAGFKPLIITYGHEVDETTPVEYVVGVRKLFPAATFFTRETDPAKIAALRFRFFDVVALQQSTDRTRADFEKAAREYLNDPAFALDFEGRARKLGFKTNKYILSNGKIYTSHAHEKADVPVGAPGANEVRDEDVWYHDMNHWLVHLL